jgi:hypothetical protein
LDELDLLRHIKVGFLEYVKGQETAYDVWNCLQDVFEKKDMTCKVKLLGLMHQPSVEILSECFLKFDKIIRELEGSIMHEPDKVCHLYLTLSDEYELTVTELRTFSERNQKRAMVK